MKKLAVIIGLMLLLPFATFVKSNGSGPTADFTWQPQHPSTADKVHFIDESTNQSNIVERIWYFGDGYGSTEANPYHKYARPGTYNVDLVVKWNISGNITYGEVNHTISIANQPPVANAGPDQLVNTHTVTFNGSKSYDPDGNITSWKWDFGDNTTGSGEVVQHTYSKDGIYTVTLNVTDDFGASDTDTCVVTTDTHPPVTTANITGSTGSNGWYIGNVTVKLQASDSLSGVDSTYYKLDNGSWIKYSSQFVISSEGIHSLEYYSKDKAGNNESVKNVTIKIDKTAPYVNITMPQQGKLYIFGRAILPLFKTVIIGKIDVNIQASDNVSGISKVVIYVNNEERANLTSPPYEWRWGGDMGKRTLKVVAYNGAGLNSSMEMQVRIYSLFKPRNSSSEQIAIENH